MQILVSGSRDWTSIGLIASKIREIVQGSVITDLRLLHGGCPTGADALADHYWRRAFGPDTITVIKADWNLGKSAGLQRNKRMVEMEPDVVLAFMCPCRKHGCHERGLHGSHGTEHTVKLARLREIPCIVTRDGFVT